MPNSYIRKTKIVCTMGPACRDDAILEDMIKSGMNVARFNFSHGTHEYHAEMMDRVRLLRAKHNLPIALLLDTKGPEIRLGDFDGGKVTLKRGSHFTLSTEQMLGTAEKASITYRDLPSQMKPGIRILADDGNIAMVVEEVTETEIYCRVTVGGVLSNRKSINIPNFHLDMEYLGERDKEDLKFGIEQNVDFVAASFVRSADDVIKLRKFLDYHGGHRIKIISKIENTEGVDNFEAILAASDGIMVARGDMGVEVAFERLPGIQKRFITRCYQSGKMAITATQMLESMIHASTPTRAEITDVANAVFDGTSAVMLSGETAAGDHPAKVVATMARIAEQAERDAVDLNMYAPRSGWHNESDVTDAICDAAATTARDMHARAIIAVTKYGGTARKVSKFRPEPLIIAATPDEMTYHQLALSWGVVPVLSLEQNDTDRLFIHAIDCAKQSDLVKKGDVVVITGGVPLNLAGMTNLLKVQTVE